MAKLDTIGAYIFKVLDSQVSLTNKNKYPQAVLRLAATKKYVEEATEIAHYQQQNLLQDGQPGWIDFTAMGEEITAYLVLFKSATDFSKDNQLMNYDQLQAAFGWDGLSFDPLMDGTYVDIEILGRVKEKKPYVNDKGQTVGEGELEIGWVDHKDASPERKLKGVDADNLATLNALLKGAKPAAAPKVAKPVAAKPVVQKPTATTSATPSPAPVPTTAAPTVAAPAPAPAKRGRPPTKPKAQSAPAPAAAPAASENLPTTAPSATTTSSPPAATTRDEAWDYVNAHGGGNEAGVINDAWIAACSEVLGDKDEEQATESEWAKIRDTVVRDLMG